MSSDVEETGRQPLRRLVMDRERLDDLLNGITRTPFRSRFALRPSELTYTASHGPDAIARHARKIVDERLAPACPDKDGRQTPWGGHPVFRAQHATATCCRKCLQTNHGIARGHELSELERQYVVAVVCRWIERESRTRKAGVPPPTLF